MTIWDSVSSIKALIPAFSLLYNGTQDTSLFFRVLFRILEGINKKDIWHPPKTPVTTALFYFMNLLKMVRVNSLKVLLGDRKCSRHAFDLNGEIEPS